MANDAMSLLDRVTFEKKSAVLLRSLTSSGAFMVSSRLGVGAGLLLGSSTPKSRWMTMAAEQSGQTDSPPSYFSSPVKLSRQEGHVKIKLMAAQGG
jgi:hypothetical protein